MDSHEQGERGVIVTEFQIDRFRDGQPLRVLDLGNGLNVAFVEDRRAQQLMLDVLPSVLYGQPVFDRKGRSGGSLPATIAVRTENGVFRVHRSAAANTASGRHDVAVTISSPDGTQHEPHFLRTLLDGVPQRRYERTFTLNTTRLWHAVQHRRERVVRSIERVALVLREASLAQAPAHTPATEALPRLNGKSLQSLDSALGELTSTLAEIARQQQDRNGKPGKNAGASEAELAEALEQLERELDASSIELSHVEKELGDIDAALHLCALQSRLEQLDRESIRIQEEKPPTKSAQHARPTRTREELEARMERCRQRQIELRELRKGLRQQVADLGRLGAVRTLLVRIEAVLLQEKFLLTEEQAIERSAEHVRELESRVEQARVHAQSRQAATAQQQTLAQQALTELDRYVDQLRRARREYVEARHQLRTLPRTVTTSPIAAKSMEQLQPSWDRPETGSDDSMSHEARRHAELSGERARIDNELSELQADRASLDELLQRLYSDQLVPFRILLWLGVPFMIGVAMIIYGLFLAGSDANWRFIGFGFAFTVAASLVKMGLDHMNGGRLVETRKQIETTDSEISDLMERADELDRQLTAAQPAGDARRSPAAGKRKRRARLGGGTKRATVSVTAEAERTKHQRARARQRAVELQRRFRDMLRRWREFLLALDLSPSLSPTEAKESLQQRIDRSDQPQEAPDRALEFQLKQLRHDLERRRAALSQGVEHVRQLTQELDPALAGATLIEQLNLLRESVQDYQERDKGRRELKLQQKKILARELRLRNYYRQLSGERRELLRAELQAARERQWFQQSSEQKVKWIASERKELLEQRKGLQQQLADREHAQGLLQLSSGELQSRKVDLISQRDGLLQQIAQQHERRGELRGQQGAVLGGEVESDLPELPWEELVAKAEKVTKYCHRVSRTTSEQFNALRKLRRPQTRPRWLQVAGDYLRRLTDGRWSTVEKRGQPDEVVVGDGMERAQSVAELPDRELFDVAFSLWMAQLDLLAEQRVRLPIVLEDPLGYTSHNPLAAAKVLRDFAATGHQLILTTRIPEHAEWFADLEVPTANFAVRFSSSPPEPTVQRRENGSVSAQDVHEAADVA